MNNSTSDDQMVRDENLENLNKEELIDWINSLENQLTSLERDLIHDKLTALKTRAFFEEEALTYLNLIAHTSHAGKRRQWFGFKNLSFLFFDIDHFKKINDTYGHATGDEVLHIVAQTISAQLREGDTVARWGGEEMVSMLLGANEVDAKAKAEEIRKAIENLVFESVKDLKVTVSIGVATAEGSVKLDELIKSADKALYKAKQTGRNKVVAYSEVE